MESNRRDGTNKNDQIIVDFLNEIDKSIWEKQSEKNKKKTKSDMYWDCNGLWCDRYKRPITGILVDHHLNGAISNERSLKDGKLEGLSRYYNKDGSLQSERIIDGEKELLRFYENNGNLETEEIKNGPKELSRRYDEFGRLMYEIYEDPTLKIKRDYDQKGNLISEFKDSEDGSTHRSYYENGDLKSESQSKDENRVVKSYYENGKLENVEFYKNNERNGTWKFYSKEGNIVEEHIYVNGVHTITRRYDTNGNLWEEYSFVKPFFSTTSNNGKLVTDFISDDYSYNIC